MRKRVKYLKLNTNRKEMSYFFRAKRFAVVVVVLLGFTSLVYYIGVASQVTHQLNKDCGS